MAAGDSRVAAKTTVGGFKSASFYSGAVAPSVLSAPNAFAVGSDVMLQSGAGRLDLIMAHASIQSGLGVTFYDAAAPVSGGPIPASGHRVVGILPPQFNTAVVLASGSADTGSPSAGVPIPVGMVFFSGLCCNLKSGQPGFTANWTSEDLR